MSLIEKLLGGGSNRGEWDDFRTRYDQGSPYGGIPDDEAYRRYESVSQAASPEVYEESAEEAFKRMSVEERREFARYLQSRARDRGLGFPDLDGDGVDDRLQDPRELARTTSRMEQQQPGILGQLLGKGGTGGAFDNPLAKAALLGITAFAAQRIMGGKR